MNPSTPRMHEYLPAHVNTTRERHWVPASTPGKSSSPLRFLDNDRGFVELLRMEPGVVMPLHRHTGEIHAWNLTGTRKLCTGEVIGPGDYVYEPPGNVDWWQVVGEKPMLALVVVMGTVEFLGPDHAVAFRASAATQLAEYRHHCREHGLAMPDLM